jgi:regulation of enolase protein 1 (concanavalin A-like superfamily)
MTLAKLLSFVLAALVFFIALRFFQAVLGPLVAAWRLGPKVEQHPVSTVAGWGDFYDPEGDCKIQESGGLLQIDVPGTLHDLSVEQGKLGAPRVLAPVEGDFALEVSVVGRVQPASERASGYALPYHGAGLLIWLDRDNYIRFERAAILRGQQPFYYVNLEQRRYADVTVSKGTATPGGPISLRLERSGSSITAAYKPEGQEWVTIPIVLSVRRWGASLKAGVVAVNTSTDPLAAEFRNLRIETKPR